MKLIKLWQSWILCIFNLFFGQLLYAQNFWHGKIINQEKKALHRVSITVKNAEGKILAYTFSDEEGLFSIQQKENDKELIFSYL